LIKWSPGISQSRRLSRAQVFLSDTYGTYWCPNQIEMDIFDEVAATLPDDDRAFLLEWYRLEDDIELPCFVLRPVRDVISGFASRDRDLYAESRRQWEAQMTRVRNLLCRPDKVDLHANYLVSGGCLYYRPHMLCRGC